MAAAELVGLGSAELDLHSFPVSGDVLQVDADELGAAEGAGESEEEESAIAQAALGRGVDRSSVSGWSRVSG
jgi:hypothetical protein